ncbi:hypothetical protein diail_6242 [Diaporthe ilicicola]|nr:hypothetical protein diail_6242 [Diaporthe ilicicola]
METIAVTELLKSNEKLYHTHEFSDLTILSRERTHHVHKAIVCPRSRFLRNECLNPPSEQPANSGIVKLFEADTKALEAVIHFLYHLDYPSDPTLLAPEDAADTTNGVNGDHNPDDSPVSVKTEEPASSLDDFLPISVSKNATKQRKKRARRKSMTRGPADPPGTITEVIVLPDDHVGMDREEGASLVQPPVVVNGSGPAHTPPRSPPADSKEGGIVLHAKVYGLSQQLGIDSLQALALLKFEAEVEQQWSSDGFIEAAKELVSILANEDGDDGKIREVILDVLCKHLELLNKEGIEGVIRGMDLGYDIVKQLSKRGLIAPSN